MGAYVEYMLARLVTKTDLPLPKWQRTLVVLGTIKLPSAPRIQKDKFRAHCTGTNTRSGAQAHITGTRNDPGSPHDSLMFVDQDLSPTRHANINQMRQSKEVECQLNGTNAAVKKFLPADTTRTTVLK